MPTATLNITLHTWWHAGTGRGAGAIADAVVNRSADGLPYLPGRSVKGLLRAACKLAEDADRLPRGRTEELFGTPLATTERAADEEERDPDVRADRVERALREARFRTAPGLLAVGSATLGADWAAWAQAEHHRYQTALNDGKEGDRSIPPPATEHLFHLVASTAVQDDGMVKPHTLRTIQVSTPMVLQAELSADPRAGDWVGDLTRVLPLLRAVGAHRNRGLGRATFSFEPVSGSR